MAEKTVISIEVEGTGKAINSIKELKAELKAAQSAALNGDGKAAKRVAELKDKMDDLTDSTKSLQGSGVERIGSGFNLLSQGFQDMDLDKIKTGFKGLGSAMSAIPIFLIIEGLKLLWDNFDVVAEFAKKFFTIASDGEKKINSLNYELEKQKETTAALSKEINRELELMEAQGKSSDKLLAKKKELIHQQIQEAISTAKLNIAKVQEVNNNDSITESIIRKNAEVLRTLGFDSKAAELEKTLAVQKYERNKDNIKSAKDSFELIKDLQNKELVETVKVNKQSNESLKKLQGDRLKDNLEAIKKIEDAQIAAIKNEELRLISAEVKANERRIKEIKDGKESAELKRQELEAQAVLYEQNISKINADAAAKRKAEEDKIAADKKAEEEKKLKALEDDKKKQLLLEQRDLKAKNEVQLLAAGEDATKQLEAKQAALEIQKNIELSNTELTESEKAAIKARYAKQSADLDEQTEKDKFDAIMKLATKSLEATQTLSDLFFAQKLSKTKKGSAEETAIAKKQFEVNKALQIAQATMQGAQAVLAAYASGSAIPIVGAVAGPLYAVAAGLVAIKNIQTIKNAQFGGGTTSVEAGSTSAPSMPTSNGTPSIAAPQQNTTTFTGNVNNNFNQPPIKTYVVETDLRSATDRQDKIKEQATF